MSDDGVTDLFLQHRAGQDAPLSFVVEAVQKLIFGD